MTVRQRKLALGVANGLSKTKVHASAYLNNLQRASREVAAKKLAKKPKVRGEIERLTLQLLPHVKDLKAAYAHAFSTIVRLTLESADDRLRFDAAAGCSRNVNAGRNWLHGGNKWPRRRLLSGLMR